MYFCKIENFAYGEINERSFSNPRPWMVSVVDHNANIFYSRNAPHYGYTA